MEVKTKHPNRPVQARDNFLADIARPVSRRMTYGDGFRLGVGIITAQLLVAVLIGGVAWGLVVALKLHW
jgi:hypothetical protein